MSYVISFFVGWFIPAEKLGFGFQGMTAPAPDGPELCLYRIELTEHTAC